MTVGRNAPCPCGSGLKYKHCCLPRDLAAAQNGAPPAPAPARKKTWLNIAIVVGLALLLGVAVSLFIDPTAGLAVALAIALLGGVTVVINNAPPPTGGREGGHAGLGFGMSPGQNKRHRSRSERRSEK